MKYVQVSFNCKPNTETITDVLASDLADIGFESFVKTEIGMDAYIPKEFFSEDKTQQLVKDFMLEADISFIPKELEDRNWNAEWEQNYFQPIVISDDCLIQSSFHNVEGNYKYRILINPKMAFGAGNHQTTSLLLRQILNMDLYKKAILDMGCGTAVLAILASMKGADPVMGIDIDEWAYNNAVENCYSVVQRNWAKTCMMLFSPI
jgi:ribosomal protein L11 methyltransferase